VTGSFGASKGGGPSQPRPASQRSSAKPAGQPRGRDHDRRPGSAARSAWTSRTNARSSDDHATIPSAAPASDAGTTVRATLRSVDQSAA
jgi:hypothetical protein